MTNTPPALSILIASDISDSIHDIKTAWLLSQVELLVKDGCEITVLGRDFESDKFANQVLQIGAVYFPPQRDIEESHDLHGLLPRIRARQVVALARKGGFDAVLVQGFDLARFVSGGKILQKNLWSWIDDNPLAPSPLTNERLELIERVAAGSRLILTSNELVRSQIESHCPATTGKTRKVDSFPPFHVKRSRLNEGPPAAFIDAKQGLEIIKNIDASLLIKEALKEKELPRLVIANIDELDAEVVGNALQLSGLDKYPGLLTTSLPIEEAPYLTETSILLVDPRKKDPITRYLEILCTQVGLRAVDGRNALFSLSTLNETLWNSPNTLPITHATSETSLVAQLADDLPDYSLVSFREKKVKVLLVGADFKFAGDLIDTLSKRRDVDLRVDLFKNNAHPQPELSTPLLHWADVIIAEFASKNAIWYSEHVLPHQTLIVRLHGYELLAEWINELNIDNVSKIVFASNFYRNKALSTKDWPEHKLLVIPNSVHPGDLNREKFDDARFHIGIVGIVPILKRPDRALDLLEQLLKHDGRFVLHIKGNPPWDYVWEWKKPVHQDAYRYFYKRIGENPNLLNNIVFEDFSPDVGNWLRKIGWILSPSTRETFHLAAIEGAASGSIPIAWRREGSEEVIGTAFNVSSTDEAVSVILDATQTPARYDSLSTSAQEYAGRYHVSKVLPMWLSLIFDQKEDGLSPELLASGLTHSEWVLESRVVQEIEEGDTDSAVILLDENIKLTAGKKGRIKDLELYVRGVAAVDEKRLTHFVPFPSQNTPAEANYLTVRVAKQTNLFMALSGLEDDVIDVVPPKYLRNFDVLDDHWDIQVDRASQQITSDSDLRYDRWAEYAKSIIVDKLVNGGFTHVITSGPTWLAFPVAKAADVLGLNFTWIIEDASILGSLNAVNQQTKNDAFAQTTNVVFNRADNRFVFDAMILNQSVKYWEISAYLSDTGKADIAGIPSLSSSNLRNSISEFPSRRHTSSGAVDPLNLQKIKVAAIGSSQFIEQLNRVVGSVIEVPIAGYFEALDPHISALLIEAEGDLEGIWKARIGHSSEQGRIPTTKILDFARSIGIPSAFLYLKSDLVEPKFQATARKADCLVTNWSQALPPILELNPCSIRSSFLWTEQLSFRANVVLLLRTLGLFIDEPIHHEDSPREKELLSEEAEAQVSVEFHTIQEDKVSLVLATHKGRERIDAMLQSIASQSLPHEFIELLVVENGVQDGTEQMVKRFSQKYPSISVRYFFENVPSAGNARNRGIKEATGSYITFVDDDDVIQRNYLLSMWLSASENSLVIGYLCDQEQDGQIDVKTPNNSRIHSLNDTRLPLNRRAGLLGLNACKLIPAWRIRDIQYDADLKSGEDTVFMAELLKYDDLEIVAASEMNEAMYIRVLRDESISRRPKGFDFSIIERVEVINRLHELQATVPKKSHGALNYLADSQGSFIREYIASYPEEFDTVRDYIDSHALKSDLIRLQ